METLDLTPQYFDLVVRAGDRVRYEMLYPELFDHYYRYWCPRDVTEPVLTRDEAKTRTERVKTALQSAERALEGFGADISHFRAALFVGGNTSNGHAFRDGDAHVIWLPVETYGTDLRASVFVMHEVIHALHYEATPALYFHNSGEKDHLGRQLITEGLATALTAEVLRVADREALWADYLNSQQYNKWLQECDQRWQEISGFCLRNFNMSEPTLGLFKLVDFDDVTRCRAGYYVGLRMVRAVARSAGCQLAELLSLSRKHFVTLALDELSRCADL